MSTFGDYEPDDSLATDGPDFEAVARIFVELERRLSGDETRPRFNDLHPWQRALLVYAFAALLARLKREGVI